MCHSHYLLFANVGLSWWNVLKVFMESTKKSGQLFANEKIVGSSFFSLICIQNLVAELKTGTS